MLKATVIVFSHVSLHQLPVHILHVRIVSGSQVFFYWNSRRRNHNLSMALCRSLQWDSEQVAVHRRICVSRWVDWSAETRNLSIPALCHKDGILTWQKTVFPSSQRKRVGLLVGVMSPGRCASWSRSEDGCDHASSEE